MSAGTSDEQAGPDIRQLAPHLQQEWDDEANAHLGSITITPQMGKKVWWSSGTCKTGQPHRWQAQIWSRARGASCPYETGRSVCPCNDLAHNHPKVAAEWDWDANGERTPETVTAGNSFKAAWRCGLCGHRWRAHVYSRTLQEGTGCPRCGIETRCLHMSRQASISDGAPHLLAEWDLEANKTHAWHPEQITLGSRTKVHWVVQDECKLGLVHRWQAKPSHRMKHGSPFPSGHSVCACNSLAVQCPEAADLWDFAANGGLTPSDVAKQSSKLVTWKGTCGEQWHQRVCQVVTNIRRSKLKYKC